MTTEPIPIRLPCPVCHELHIDTGEFATKSHHTHACQFCGHVWRPAIVATVGVRFLPGFRGTETDRRNQQLKLIPGDWKPIGWVALHDPGSTDRVYMHHTGARVRLSEAGLWDWWRAEYTHGYCFTPRGTIESALRATQAWPAGGGGTPP